MTDDSRLSELTLEEIDNVSLGLTHAFDCELLSRETGIWLIEIGGGGIMLKSNKTVSDVFDMAKLIKGL